MSSSKATLATPQKQYSRDKRSPVPKHEGISRVMSAIRAKNTDPEIKLKKELRANGLTGYRLNWKNAPGRPDIAFPGRKVAIFVHGCYWHRCPICAKPLPKHNTEFWENKFSKNTTRDKAKAEQLEALGWKVITVWECQIKTDMPGVMKNILQQMLPQV